MSETTLGVTRREALKRGVALGGAAAIWATPTAQAFAMTVADGEATSGAMGCTPGYWKNHSELWTDRNVRLGEAFVCDGGLDWKCIGDGPAGPYESYTILQALSLQGGNSQSEKLEIFFRAAAAAYLNSIYTPNYPVNASNLRQEICVVLGKCGDSDFLDQVGRLASVLDAANNNGCPFGRTLEL